MKPYVLMENKETIYLYVAIILKDGYKGDCSVRIICLPSVKKAFPMKSVFSKRKKNVPLKGCTLKRGKYFSFRVDPYTEGALCAVKLQKLSPLQ